MFGESVTKQHTLFSAKLWILNILQGKLFILRTFDAGVTWIELSEAERPQVLEGQGGFAASGTCLVTKVTFALSPASKASKGVYWNQAQKNVTHLYTEYPWVSVILWICGQ